MAESSDARPPSTTAAQDNVEQREHSPIGGRRTTCVMVFVLSLLLWVGYYYLNAGIIPSPQETSVLVLVAFAVTLCGRRLRKTLRSGRKYD